MRQSSLFRTRAIRVLIVALALVGLASGAVYAQETPTPAPAALAVHALGDQSLSLNLGVLVPLFFQSFADGSVSPTNLNVGGMASLRWETYLSSNLFLGVDLSGVYTSSVNQEDNRRNLLMVPITARIGYTFVLSPFEIPISFGIGANISSLRSFADDLFHIDPILRPEASFFWSFNSQWMFGVNVSYWWIPQFAWGTEMPADQGRMGNFLSAIVSLKYSFN